MQCFAVLERRMPSTLVLANLQQVLRSVSMVMARHRRVLTGTVCEYDGRAKLLSMWVNVGERQLPSLCESRIFCAHLVSTHLVRKSYGQLLQDLPTAICVFSVIWCGDLLVSSMFLQIRLACQCSSRFILFLALLFGQNHSVGS